MIPMKFSSANLTRLIVFAAVISRSGDLSALAARSLPEPKETAPAFLIEDSSYVLSPGDQVRVQWWGTGSGDQRLIVDTRGDLLVPEVGIVQARKRPFKDVRRDLEQLVTTRFRPRVLSIRIVEVQPATIWIRGEVPSPGPQTIEPGTRLSVALASGGISVSELLKAGMTSYPARGEELAWMPSLRRTLVVRNGDTLAFDLTKAFRAGDESQDPSLYSGDVVTVLPMRTICAIRGSRSIPTVLEVVPGETVASFLRATGLATQPTKVVVTRRSGEQVSVDSGSVVPEDAMVVAFDSSQRPQNPRVVFVVGPVRNPGAYPFQVGMTARDAVALAGGAVERSDSVLMIGVQRLGAAILPGRKPGSELLPSVAEVAKAQIGYQGFTRGQYSTDQIALQSLDSVIVKRAEPVVWVGGHVTRPGFVPWVRGGTWRDYVDAAGGFTDRAWEGQTRLVDPVTDQISPIDGEIRPGAAILVPEERFIPPEQWLTIGLNFVSLLTGLATVYLLMESSK